MKRWIVLAVLAAALLIGGFVYWQSNANLPLDDLVSDAGSRPHLRVPLLSAGRDGAGNASGHPRILVLTRRSAPATLADT
ncbi:MAG TPA: hypothetical protein VJA46_13150 [Acidimicrobiia bacterium]|nr:hypothetical protein [Acidimicrobiia bacterium]